MLVLVVHNDALRSLAGKAAARLASPPLVLDASPDARVDAGRALVAALRDSRDPHGGLLVHDFAPDAEASARWLDAVGGAWPALTVLALLGSPAGAALHQLVGHPRRFACADVVLGREITAPALGDRLAEATRALGQAATVRALATGWPLDALLLGLARHAFAMTGDGPSWPTLDALLRTAGVSRGTFVRHAAAAGFRPPLRFLQLLRVLGVAAAVRGGETAASAAARFGYGSADTLRRHFAGLTGLTPRDARHVDADDLIARMRAAGGA
ncbi:helix-turn-helix domain-containing protein [Roseisolibacter agri]|uniref:HTH araC/xylS-type domain-containing protein n=1 Tax=Roseisolibacter agri TaxID=2014610 RepID=A0AA37V1E4_9BACT|nr:AraC family transcriptional regulator [Roseisolibacter agri]GLC23652.1 hypothetical protein rosag_01650 [Roseisolibacter agri]